jgi:hypothetical protein
VTEYLVTFAASAKKELKDLAPAAFRVMPAFLTMHLQHAKPSVYGVPATLRNLPLRRASLLCLVSRVVVRMWPCPATSKAECDIMLLMDFSLVIASSTDHLTLTLPDGNGNFILDAAQTWHMSGSVAPSLSSATSFYCNINNTQFSIGQQMGSFNPLNAVVRVNIADGTTTMNISVDRGGIGNVTIQAALPANGTVTPNTSGLYTLALTSAGIQQLEQELGLAPKPKDHKPKGR